MLVERWTDDEMFLTDVGYVVDVETVVPEVTFLYLKGCLADFVQLYFFEDVKVADWVSKEKDKITDLTVVKVQRGWIDWNF